MSKRLPGLVIEVENLPGFLAKSDEDILRPNTGSGRTLV
jgi:hypothetical protein